MLSPPHHRASLVRAPRTEQKEKEAEQALIATR